MQEAISLWPLIGIAVIVVGFVLRFNPVLVVIISGIVTGVAAHMPIATILEKLGGRGGGEKLRRLTWRGALSSARDVGGDR